MASNALAALGSSALHDPGEINVSMSGMSSKDRQQSKQSKDSDDSTSQYASSGSHANKRLSKIVDKHGDGDEEVANEHKPFHEQNLFQGSIAFLVMANTLQLGLEADNPDWTDAWMVCEHVFAAGFLLETVIKLRYMHRHYFDKLGNWFDLLLVVTAIFDAWVLPMIRGLLGDNLDLRPLTALRFLRLTRIVRAVKLIKMFRPLILIFQGVVIAVKATFWVSIVLSIAIYICSIFCVELVGRTGDLYPGNSNIDDVIDEQEIMTNFNPYLAFGTMGRSMLTLFSVSVLAEWPELIKPIMVKQPHLVLGFVAFVLFVTFGVVNIIVALIVDSVIKAASAMDRSNQECAKQRQKSTLQEIQKWVFSHDLGEEDDGKLTSAKLQKDFEDEAFHDLFERLNLPHGCTAEELIEILDDDGDGALEPEEFTASIFRLIEGNEFQHRCEMKMNTNQVKILIRDLKTHVSDTVTQESGALHQELRQQMQEMRREMQSGFSKMMQMGPDGHASGYGSSTTADVSSSDNSSGAATTPSLQNTAPTKAAHTTYADDGQAFESTFSFAQSQEYGQLSQINAIADAKLLFWGAAESKIIGLSLDVTEIAIKQALALSSSIEFHHQSTDVSGSPVHAAPALPGLEKQQGLMDTLRHGLQDALAECFITTHRTLMNLAADSVRSHAKDTEGHPSCPIPSSSAVYGLSVVQEGGTPESLGSGRCASPGNSQHKWEL